MSRWIHHVSALFGSPATAVPSAVAALGAHPAPARQSPTPAASSAQPEPRDLQVDLFEWLIGTAPTIDTPLRAAEQRLLAHLDTVLACDSARAALLPRAPAVIPQLLACLRDAGRSADALAQRVAKDAHLVAEVIRLANSSATRGNAPVTDLPQAITRLGTEGLRRAIAKVVLRPIFDAPPASLSGRAAPRLWLHSEAQAAACVPLAAAAGVDPFEGYLAGLMHNIGWTAALRALDTCRDPHPSRFSRAFAPAFAQRCETFFALLAMPWQITETLTALAAELIEANPAVAGSPLARALRGAERSAALEMLETPQAVAA